MPFHLMLALTILMPLDIMLALSYTTMPRQLPSFRQDELSSLRGGRRRLGFGFSSDDIENAIKEVEDIEAELLEEMYGVDINYADNMLNLETQIVCPVCQVLRT